MIDRRTLAVLLTTLSLIGGCETARPIDDGSADAQRDAAMDGTTSLDANADADAAASCSMDRTSCSGSCVDLNSDPTNCGSCGMMCPAGANQTAFCERGTCRVTCATGFTDCDMMASNGCEANTNTDPDHCGGCATRCMLPNAVAVCTAGSCAVASCAEGTGDCDGTASTGCETMLNTAEHCGSCARSCGTAGTSAVTCTAGACVATCDDTHADCDADPSNGCETAINTAAHCGGCAIACPNATDNCCYEVIHNPGACVASTLGCF